MTSLPRTECIVTPPSNFERYDSRFEVIESRIDKLVKSLGDAVERKVDEKMAETYVVQIAEALAGFRHT
eukprot:374211-Karenia_brevis.AAC.1